MFDNVDIEEALGGGGGDNGNNVVEVAGQQQQQPEAAAPLGHGRRFARFFLRGKFLISEKIIAFHSYQNW